MNKSIQSQCFKILIRNEINHDINLIDDTFLNLEILLSDQKGVHKASAHLWIEGFLQTTEDLQVLFSKEGDNLLIFPSVTNL